MSQWGMGVMINMLCGEDRGTKLLDEAVNGKKKIAALSLDADEGLRVEFKDGTKFRIWDNGQSCCERRYMTTDDDLKHYVGSTIRDVELADAPGNEDEYGECHEVQFLRIKTTKGTLVLESHNEHNGYYGGFYIVITAE
jgi:hypothetical protein